MLVKRKFDACYGKEDTECILAPIRKIVTDQRYVMLFSTLYFFLILTATFRVSSSALSSSMEPEFGFVETYEWSNDIGSIADSDTIMYDDGSLARLILKTEGDNSIPLPPFGCGFVSLGSDPKKYFFAVVILGGANTSIANRQVWLANRESPIQEKGTLEFTAEGGLVLRDTNGTEVWSSSTHGKSLVGIRLGDIGSLQLYNDNYTVWESFDQPGDALLPGQMLYNNVRLGASASTENWKSGGLYYVQMTSEGLTAFVQADKQLQYLHLELLDSNREFKAEAGGVRGQPYTRPRSGPHPKTYAMHDAKNLILTVEGTNYSYQISPESAAAGSYQYLRLDFDGHFRTYSWSKTNLSEAVYDLVTEQVDSCQHPNVCGDYGICDRGGKCSCPKVVINGSAYFKQTEGSSTTGFGCSENVNFSCQSPSDQHHELVNFRNLSHFSFIDSTAANQSLGNLDACKKACLGDCECRASFFKYNDSMSDGECYVLYVGQKKGCSNNNL